MHPIKQECENIIDWLQNEIKPPVDERIHEKFSGGDFSDMLLYQIQTGGKRWRPALTMLTGQLLDLEETTIIDMATGIEFLHNFTLVHDDLMDGDRSRRGEPAVWVKFGEASAINIGDLMYTKSLQLFPHSVHPLVLSKVSDLITGQQMDLNFETKRNITVDQYMTMVSGKTGSLLELSLEAPQAMSDKNLNIDAYANLGPAFQIRDDLIDFEKAKGRDKIGNDIRAGKRTLMVIHANDEELYDILDKPFEETTEQDVEQSQLILRENGSFEFARRKMKTLADEALESTRRLPESPQRDRLYELGKFLVERQG